MLEQHKHHQCLIMLSIKYTTWPKCMSTTEHFTYLIVTMGINVLLHQPPLFWLNTFHQILEHGCRDLLLSISEVQDWCWEIRPGSQSCSSQRCRIGLRSELCEGQSSFSTLNCENHLFIDLTLCMRALSCWNCIQVYVNRGGTTAQQHTVHKLSSHAAWGPGCRR